MIHYYDEIHHLNDSSLTYGFQRNWCYLPNVENHSEHILRMKNARDTLCE